MITCVCDSTRTCAQSACGFSNKTATVKGIIISYNTTANANNTNKQQQCQ